MANIEIKGRDGCAVGSLRFAICHDREELEKCHDFKSALPSLEQCLHYVDLEEEYPVAFLIHISVDENRRRDGYGSTLLTEFEKVSADCGCKLTACKVAWPEGWPTRAGIISFYKNSNWNLYDPSEDEPVMAFKKLDATFPKEALKRQMIAKLDVYWKDENFTAPLAPRLIE